jgi:hypothetical protein
MFCPSATDFKRQSFGKFAGQAGGADGSTITAETKLPNVRITDALEPEVELPSWCEIRVVAERDATLPRQKTFAVSNFCHPARMSRCNGSLFRLALASSIWLTTQCFRFRGTET